MFQVRVKGSREAFQSALRERDAQSERTPRGDLVVETPAAGARIVFEAAVASACQIRHLTPLRQSLSDMFATTVREDRHADP